MARTELDRTGLEAFLTESDRPPPAGCSAFDSLLGLAVRHHCGPVLGLSAGAPAEEYLARRAELGATEANRRLLSSARLDALLVDTGLAGGDLLDLRELAEHAGAPAHEVLRLETLAEDVASRGVAADDFAPAFAEALHAQAPRVVALKSIIAYRHGLDFDPTPPQRAEVARAAHRWLSSGGERLDDIVLLRHLLWEGLATGLPLQLHTGFGDPDLDLRRCDPALLTHFLRACADAAVPVLLLHCYPFHRHAAYLANVLPHVYLDIGLTIPHVGGRAAALLAETLELAPFHKLLYSSDAYGLAELYLTAAMSFRNALDEAFASLGVSGAERGRIAAMIGSGNARRVYKLPEVPAEGLGSRAEETLGGWPQI